MSLVGITARKRLQDLLALPSADFLKLGMGSKTVAYILGISGKKEARLLGDMRLSTLYEYTQHEFINYNADDFIEYLLRNECLCKYCAGSDAKGGAPLTLKKSVLQRHADGSKHCARVKKAEAAFKAAHERAASASASSSAAAAAPRAGAGAAAPAGPSTPRALLVWPLFVFRLFSFSSTSFHFHHAR